MRTGKEHFQGLVWRAHVIKFVTSTAHKIDKWLHIRLGRSYRVLLTVGLIADIGHRVLDAPRQIASHHHLLGIVLSVLLELGLLIHQVAEMDERLGFRQELQPNNKKPG